jgi:DHA1 family tetracycline resistance protein-like MFS transporter
MDQIVSPPSQQHVELGRKRQPALFFIFITALMDVISLGIMIPVLPFLIKAMVGGSTANASLWTGVFGTVWAGVQFFAAPVIGMISDRFGRRPVILASIGGLGVDFLFMALAPTLPWLFLGRVINGLTAASFSTASAYVADVTPPEGRAKAFGMMGAAFGAGFLIGPAIGGMLGEMTVNIGFWHVEKYRLPFYVAAGMALINWLYGCFILPESLPVERRAKTFIWARANPVGSLNLLRRHRDLLGLGGVGFLFYMAHNVLPQIFALYMGYRYHFGTAMVGVSLMVTGVANIIVQALMVGPVVKKLGERGALLAGLAFGTVGFLIFALAPNAWVYWCGVPVFALMGFAQPGLQGLMTRRVGPSEQGQLQGANSSIMGLTGLIGPALYTVVFAWAVGPMDHWHQPGIPILIASACMAGALVLAYFVAHRQPDLETTAP